MKKKLIQRSRQLAPIAKSLRGTLDRWGYEEIFLPTIEKETPTLDKGTKFVYQNDIYLVKPDLTSQLLENLINPENQRMFYISEVLDGGVDGEWQCGVEYIGGESLQMTVELLVVVISTLEGLGIEDFYVDVGSIQVWEEAISDVEKYRDRVFQALYERNFELIEELPIDKEKKEQMWDLFNFRARTTDYEKLSNVMASIDSSRLYVDYGTVRPLPYYEDIIFEIYSPQASVPLGAGGEYEFNGYKAFGFAFDLEVIPDIADFQEGQDRVEIQEGLRASYEKAQELVNEGVPVEVKPCKS